MYERKETKGYIWIIPLIAACLATIAILFPTAKFSSGGVTWDWWMWNFTTMGMVGYEPLSLFVSVVDFIIISIITTSVVLLSAVNLFILSIKTKKRNLNTKNFILMSIISAVLLICIMIYYIIAMGIAFYKGFTIEGVPFPPGIRFWNSFNPGFGLFLPFISAILSFVGVGLFKSFSNRKDDIIKYKMDATTGYVPYSKQMRSINFCPECGKKILHAGVKFCTNCGFNLK